MREETADEHDSRAPCGARGLKYRTLAYSPSTKMSRPVRGARIEIGYLLREQGHSETSRPVRGARIEISITAIINLTLTVAPRAGRAG